MTLRRFMVLLKGLPADSAWAAFVQNKDEYSLAMSNIQDLKV